MTVGDLESALQGDPREDTTGGVLAEDYLWYFTTAMPSVVWTTPADSEVLVATTQAINIIFNQPMDHASVEERFSLAAETGGAVQGVAIAWALVRESELYFLDGPLSNLDFKRHGDLRKELKELHHKSGCVRRDA